MVLPEDIKSVENTETETREKEEFVVYIGNLNFDITLEGLENLVKAKTGIVPNKITLPLNRRPGSSINRGYAFVQVNNEEEVAKIINDLNGFECEGREGREKRILTVSKPFKDTPGASRGRGNGRGFRGGRYGTGRDRGRGRMHGREVTALGPEHIAKYYDSNTQKEHDVVTIQVNNLHPKTEKPGFLKHFKESGYPIFKCDDFKMYTYGEPPVESQKAFLLVPKDTALGMIKYMETLAMDESRLYPKIRTSDSLAARKLLGTENNPEMA